MAFGIAMGALAVGGAAVSAYGNRRQARRVDRRADRLEGIQQRIREQQEIQQRRTMVREAMSARQGVSGAAAARGMSQAGSAVQAAQASIAAQLATNLQFHRTTDTLQEEEIGAQASLQQAQNQTNTAQSAGGLMGTIGRIGSVF